MFVPAFAFRSVGRAIEYQRGCGTAGTKDWTSTPRDAHARLFVPEARTALFLCTTMPSGFRTGNRCEMTFFERHFSCANTGWKPIPHFLKDSKAGRIIQPGIPELHFGMSFSTYREFDSYETNRELELGEPRVLRLRRDSWLKPILPSRFFFCLSAFLSSHLSGATSVSDNERVRAGSLFAGRPFARTD